MSEVTQEYPLDTSEQRLTVKEPQPRHDTQGDMDENERLRRAMANLAKNMNRTTATYLEACVHCGQCAEACHYYVQTEDPKYTPIWKLEIFKQAYKREASPFGFFYRLLGLKRKISIEQLGEWQELIYDSCTMCGRCSLMCPMGIDIATLVGQARHGMFKAGLIPDELHAVAQRAKDEGSPLGATASVFEDRADWMADEHETEVYVDEDQAEVEWRLRDRFSAPGPARASASARMHPLAGQIGRLDRAVVAQGHEHEELLGQVSGNGLHTVRHGRCRAGVEHGDVGVGAALQRSDRLLQAQGPGVAQGDHVERLPGGQVLLFQLQHLVGLGKGAQHGIAGAAAHVRGHPYTQRSMGRPSLGQVEQAAADEQVRRRAEYGNRPGLAQTCPFRRRQVDAVAEQ